jgi:hypothetical protein
MQHSRKKKWIHPELQLGLLVLIGAAAVVAVAVQSVVFARAMGLLAKSLPNDAAEVAFQLPGLILRTAVGTLLLLTPTLYFLGLGLTFRIFGPVYRFRTFLRSVQAGEQVDECRLREGDRLKDLCVLLNEVTAERRRQNANKQAKPVAGQTGGAGQSQARSGEQAA